MHVQKILHPIILYRQHITYKITITDFDYYYITQTNRNTIKV